jgi:hypothetical protein
MGLNFLLFYIIDMKAFFVVLMFLIIAPSMALAQPVYKDLIAGRNMKVGDVIIWNDVQNIYVKYVTVGWCLTETHLAAGSIPMTKSGSPKVGNFQYGMKHNCIKEYAYTVPLKQEYGDCIDMAAHAIVKGRGTETAWAYGESFQKSWAMHFSYCIQKSWILPTEPIQLVVGLSPGGSNNYFDLILSDIGNGYNISDGVWTGWCVDTKKYIYVSDPPTFYYPNVYSSTDPDLATKCPYCVVDKRWDYINYILNHKTGTWQDIQTAIWNFSETSPEYQWGISSSAQLMINDALAHGSGFVPGRGQMGAVILDNGPDVQLVFVEVDP